MFKLFYAEIIKDFGTRTYNDIESKAPEIKAQKKFDFLTDDIKRYVDDITAEKVVLITETTKKEIKKIVAKAIEEGKSIPETELMIDGLYLDNIIPNRSRTIARTEVVSASNYGSMAGAKQTSSKLNKIWIPTFDDSTRESHLAMANHPPIGLNQLFNVNGFWGEAPGDFNLPASEVINCRCAIGYDYAGIVQPTQTTIKDEVTELKESIINKHKSTFENVPDGEIYMKELEQILDNVTKEDLILYDKLSDFAKTNDYFQKNAGWYDYNIFKVEMNLSGKGREKHFITNRNGDFAVKFHEEFHQLDDLLSSTKFSEKPNGLKKDYFALSGFIEQTKISLKIKETAEKDLLKFSNEIIEEYNMILNTNVNALNDLLNISDEQLKAIAYRLKQKFYTGKEQWQATMMTDALGGATKGRISPSKLNLVGHDDSYYINHDTVASEIWAEYGAYRFAYDEEAKKVAKELMPETIKLLDKIYLDIVEYVKNNDLKYSRK